MNRRIQVSLQPAFVLHRYPYRNTSLLADVFTARHGRIGLVARGARTMKSRYHGLLQPFRPLLVSWAGRGDLYTLTGVEPDGPMLAPRGRALMCAFYVNELLMRMVHRYDPHEGLFSLYADTLQGLWNCGEAGGAGSGNRDESQEQAAATTERLLRIFEKHLLRELGYGLVLDHAVDCNEPIRPEQRYCYISEKGPVARHESGETGITLSGRSLLSLANEELYDPDSLRETKQLMRAVMAKYLGDRPLKSRTLFTNMMP